MTLFEESTQHKFWLFNKTTLQQVRADALKRYRDEVATLNNEDVSIQDKTLELNALESQALRYFYEKRVVQHAKAFHLPPCVIASAVIFFKRFYACNTMMDDEPRLIAIACIVLSSKCEEVHTRINDLAVHTDVSVETLVQCEQSVLKALNFQIKLHHPFKAMYGHLRAIKLGSKAASRALETECVSVITQSLHTDAPLLYVPTHIALAALRRAAKKLGCIESLNVYINTLTTSDEEKVLLRTRLDDVDTLVDSLELIDTTEDYIGRLKHRRYQHRNLLRDRNSDVFKAQIASEEAQREEKRREKNKKNRERCDLRVKEILGDCVDKTSDSDSEFVIHSNLKKRRCESKDE